ncbi:Permuted papain-like amidase enzyme, YaeF/YiiX, C92 family [Halopseudomonas xinjiangensis]|uniref:Permuted papain-like amidase enzyme, YaeF/YiiX, C92 family n=1 Tax=Halopseudomonas xinjiangensis TaxID=487184 RepID=A0A1H1QF17_9GAMM|nr:YiiX/YebB-like N1pC/P60 family cysteine hydrolase [Halopseudomonas xinjiangensis]SDS22088.1 Permuted papain-like amidase enzyme, YaeF/YiiX, C92 family [Halopseudomonas xinjiangensis]
MKIVFSTGPHLSSWALRTALMSEWSHCGVIMEDDKTVIEASAKHGVVETPVEKFTRYGRWVIQDVPVPDEAAAYAAAREELGKGYDWLGLLGIAAQRDWNHADRWFCSELVQWAKVSGGLLDLRFDQRRITPRDLWLLPYPVTVSEGVKAGTA